eukprot:scaffold12745_cov30-Attheya_sp.AAC.1
MRLGSHGVGCGDTRLAITNDKSKLGSFAVPPTATATATDTPHDPEERGKNGDEAGERRQIEDDNNKK